MIHCNGVTSEVMELRRITHIHNISRLKGRRIYSSFTEKHRSTRLQQELRSISYEKLKCLNNNLLM